MSMCDWCRNTAYCKVMEDALYNAVNGGGRYCETFSCSLPIISMGMTSPPFVNEEKSVTRRDWASKTTRKFPKGQFFQAFSKQLQFGGEAIGIGKIWKEPIKESTGEMTCVDPELEGFEYLCDRWEELNPGKDCPLVLAFVRWCEADIIMTVIPFDTIEIFPGMKDKYSTDEEIVKAVKALVEALP